MKGDEWEWGCAAPKIEMATSVDIVLDRNKF